MCSTSTKNRPTHYQWWCAVWLRGAWTCSAVDWENRTWKRWRLSPLQDQSDWRLQTTDDKLYTTTWSTVKHSQTIHIYSGYALHSIPFFGPLDFKTDPNRAFTVFHSKLDYYNLAYSWHTGYYTTIFHAQSQINYYGICAVVKSLEFSCFFPLRKILFCFIITEHRRNMSVKWNLLSLSLNLRVYKLVNLVSCSISVTSAISLGLDHKHDSRIIVLYHRLSACESVNLTAVYTDSVTQLRHF